MFKTGVDDYYNIHYIDLGLEFPCVATEADYGRADGRSEARRPSNKESHELTLKLLNQAPASVRLK